MSVHPPLIGLVGRRIKGRDLVEYPPTLNVLDMDLYFADYGRAVAEAGGIPVHIPIETDIAALAPRLDGIVLTGGTDIDPAIYGVEPKPGILVPEPERDELETALYHEARARELPVLGICRGIQLINVAEGGTLHQHVPEHFRLDLPTHTEVHPVELAPGSILASLYGPHRQVNSLHHQSVDDVGQGLTVTAAAADGEIEGVEAGDTVVAVQWHPEMMTSRSEDPIFAWLVERAAKVAAGR